MVKLCKLLRIQKLSIIICVLLVLLGATVGIFVNSTFSRLSLNQESYDNAVVEYDESMVYYTDYMVNKTSIDEAVYILDEIESAFVIECISIEHCYNCTKYNARVINTIKSKTDETGKEIVVYQWVSFDKYNDTSLIFASPDNSLPLIEGKEYLVFVRKRNYCKEYQNTLDCNEYSMDLKSPVPTAYIVNDTQKDYIDVNRDKNFKAIKDKYYMCYSEESLKNINYLSKKVVEHFCRN